MRTGSVGDRSVFRRLSPGTLTIGVVWCLLAGWIGIRLAGRAPDDMYITFRYAWNLAHGEGFVFNPGERVFGLTNPGLGLLLGLLHWMSRAPVHLLGTVVYGASLWGLAMLLWSEGRRHGYRFEAVVGGSLLVGSSYVWLNQGSASVTVLALLVGSARLAERWPAWAGLLAGAAVWCRPDAGLGVIGLGLVLWIGRRRFPWRWALAVCALTVVGLLAAWAWFGSFLPGTLEAKQVMAGVWGPAWAGPLRFWARFGVLAPRHWGAAWQLAAAMGIVGLWPLYSRGGRGTRALVLYATAIAVAYPLLGVPFYTWYAVPCVVAILYGLAGTVGGAARGLASAMPDRGGLSRAVVAGVAVALLAVPAASIVKRSSRWVLQQKDSTRFQAYREAGRWIREHTSAEHRVAWREIGNLAYWSRRPVDDLMGLVTPEMLPYVAAGDWVGAVLRLRPDVYVNHPGRSGIPELPFFRRAYYLVAEKPPPDAPEKPPVAIFRRRPGAELPPPRPPVERPVKSRPGSR